MNRKKYFIGTGISLVLAGAVTVGVVSQGDSSKSAAEEIVRADAYDQPAQMQEVCAWAVALPERTLLSITKKQWKGYALSTQERTTPEDYAEALVDYCKEHN